MSRVKDVAPDDLDMESTRVRRAWLRAALEHGGPPGADRRQAPWLLASLLVASLACAGCVGYAAVSSLTEPTASQATTTGPASPSPADQQERQ
ncbi:hypothetical protein [Actinomyces howellii]|uniref:Uncharacterized protein n=1 Tax=Actinomyces howellii TaxID=52771 RepID=A0A448HI51_9ACTO|nr:hypothetical protein [Actinomyces howellii]VEG29070.1 Uncharacterised protein [Actinomyces howellii]